MKAPVQKRTLDTRNRLVTTAETLVSVHGFEALRVEDVVQGAGVAKGTFFAHFRDKDALMDMLIGARIDQHLDRIDALPTPRNVAEIVDAIQPLMHFMTSERYVFDVILRYSGAAMIDDIGAIALSFDRQMKVLARWMQGGPFRQDISSDMLAEGVQAFAVQVMALHFCALHNDVTLADRLKRYLDAWLLDRDAL